MRRIFVCLLSGTLLSSIFLQGALANAPSEKVLHSFAGYSTDGARPQGTLTNVGGTFYGTTTLGGTQCAGYTGCGTVFSVNPKTGVVKTVYSFGSTVNDGWDPQAALTNVNGTLYGTTRFGGTDTHGTVFAFNPKTRTETVVYAFGTGNNADGESPMGDLVYVNGLLYGTAFYGGANFSGVVFSVDPNTGAERIVYAFQNSHADGRNPAAGLINVNGTLYGTTFGGGSNLGGTVFALNPTTGAETVLYSFGSGAPDAHAPIADLIYANGLLYGTTQYGGADSNGTVFSVDPATGVETVVYSFCPNGNCAAGADPVAPVLYENGTLYGTAGNGGTSTNCSYGCGTVFSIKNP